MGLDRRMKGDSIPDKDHIARYCAPKTIDDGKILASAFLLRENEDGLSVNWLEYLGCASRDLEIAEVRKAYSAKLSVGAKAKVAVLNAGEVREKIETESPDNRILDILHEPEEKDPSHSEIYNLKPDCELIAELILQAVNETYSARP